MAVEIALLPAAVTPGPSALTGITVWKDTTMATVIRIVTMAGVYTMEMTACLRKITALNSKLIFVYLHWLLLVHWYTYNDLQGEE